MYLISACLCGVNCKYNGKNNINSHCVELLHNGDAILVCPEQLGGLTTPRKPSEIVKKNCFDEKTLLNVFTNEGDDVTRPFINGAKEAINIAKRANIKKAILKEGSPSCGCNFIYDGSFTGKKIKGKGITCIMLEEAGINVISDEDYNRIIEKSMYK